MGLEVRRGHALNEWGFLQERFAGLDDLENNCAMRPLVVILVIFNVLRGGDS